MVMDLPEGVVQILAAMEIDAWHALAPTVAVISMVLPVHVALAHVSNKPTRARISMRVSVLPLPHHLRDPRHPACVKAILVWAVREGFAAVE